MKLQYLFQSLAVTAALLCPLRSPAEDATSPIQAEIQTLVKSMDTKITAGKRSEADLAEDLKQFDTLISKENGARTDEAADIVFLKAQVYLEVLNNLDQGTALIKQLKTDYPETRAGRQADRMLPSLEKQISVKKIQESLAVGTLFPDFAGKDMQGQPLSVSQYKGKVVLVDFWATWCGPCLAELPNVIETYGKYHSQGFEIIGVSLDSDREKLVSFLKKQDGMVWPQYFDGEAWESKMPAKYGVAFIPFTVLIGPDGKIIGKALGGADLSKAVADALGKK